MEPKIRAYLYDMQRATDLIAQFTDGQTFNDYAQNEMLRAAVEREFEIVGEAMAQLARLDDQAASQVSEHERIIAFRNILIHGYAQIDHQTVWEVIETKLPILRREIDTLLHGA